LKVSVCHYGFVSFLFGCAQRNFAEGAYYIICLAVCPCLLTRIERIQIELTLWELNKICPQFYFWLKSDSARLEFTPLIFMGMKIIVVEIRNESYLLYMQQFIRKP